MLVVNELLLVPTSVVPLNHSYLAPLPALEATESVAPWHMVFAVGCVVIVGKAFTFTATVLEFTLQPLTSVTFT